MDTLNGTVDEQRWFVPSNYKSSIVCPDIEAFRSICFDEVSTIRLYVLGLGIVQSQRNVSGLLSQLREVRHGASWIP